MRSRNDPASSPGLSGSDPWVRFGVAARLLVGAALALGYLRAFPDRRDYLGHFLAAFGATLLLIQGLAFLGRPRRIWMQAAFAVLAGTAAGFLLEKTLFQTGRFDPVDFVNQSLGVLIAGLTVDWDEPPGSRGMMSLYAIFGAAAAVGGFLVAG